MHASPLQSSVAFELRYSKSFVYERECVCMGERVCAFKRERESVCVWVNVMTAIDTFSVQPLPDSVSSRGTPP